MAFAVAQLLYGGGDDKERRNFSYHESTDEMTFTVNSIDEKGNYDITMNLVGKDCLLRLKEKHKALILKEVHQLNLNKNLCGKSKKHR